MLTKALSLLLVIFLGLAFGLETARFVHAHIAGGVAGVSGMVNIHRALLGFSLLATSGALLLSLRGAVVGVWLSRLWSRFTARLELALDGLFDFNSLNVGDGLGSVSVHKSAVRGDVVAGHIHTLKQLHSGSVRLEPLPPPGTPDCEACAQDAFDDAAKTTCTGCGDRGHWWPDCPSARPPSREGRQHSEALFFQGGHGHVGPGARRHTETSCSMLSRDPDINGGDLCITGTRIPIWILWDARSGSNFQEYIDNLRMDYPNLSSEQIKAALQYAFSHPSEIDKDRFRHEVEECEGSETERQLAHPRVQNKA